MKDHDIVEWYIPGPVDVDDNVLDAMSVRPYGHRTLLMTERVKSINQNMLSLLDADPEKYTVLLFGGSGTNALEAARSFASPDGDDTVLSVSNGYFGDLWADILESNHVPVDRMRDDDRKPLDMEELRQYLDTGYRTVAVTHNETSTGTTNNLLQVAEVLKEYDNVLFMIDAVSSLGGVPI